MRIVLGFLVIGYSLTYGIEYRFNKIAQIPCGTAIIDGCFLLLIGDTDHDGLNELIFTNNTLEDREYPYRFEIWEYAGENSYKRVYQEEPLQTDSSIKSFSPMVLGDIDKDGLADIIGMYGYKKCATAGGSSTKVVMRESPDYYSHPTKIVWEKKYIDAFDPNYRWAARPIIIDMDKDGRNEYIFTYDRWIFIAKCIENNRIELIDSVKLDTSYGWGKGWQIMGDFDMDGKYELVSTMGLRAVGIYENTENYEFRLAWRETIWVPGMDVFSSRDSDGDGKPEFFIGNYFAMGNTFWLYRWETNGDDSYKRMLIDSVWVNTWLPGKASSCGDVDGDGIDEIVWSIGKKVFVYKSIGNDRYERVWEWVIPNINSWNGPRVGIRVYDMNKNGYPEIIASVQSDIEKVTKIFEIDTTCLSVVSNSSTPKSFNLSISPNPAKGMVDIKYKIPDRSPVSLKVYNAEGRLAKIITEVQNQRPGVYTIKWDGRDERKILSAGVYFIKLEAKGITRIKKVILMR